MAGIDYSIRWEAPDAVLAKVEVHVAGWDATLRDGG
jgi:hypothetical protein